jgi:glutamate 5-kinase
VTTDNLTQRSRHLAAAKRVVIKVGSSLLAGSPVGQPAAIADAIEGMATRSKEFVVVSSGAIALGLSPMGLSSRPSDLPRLQAAAAVGQNRLLNNWEHAFSAHGKHIAQILLTHDDMVDRARFLNARHALRALLDAGIVPVVNENDSVAADEIKYGDNDQLAALVCNLISADALVILTDVDGLCDAPPSQGGKRIPLVTDIDSEALPYAGGTTSGGVGSGGMRSKVQAAAVAARFGVATAVVAGKTQGVLARLLAGEDLGTLFVPAESGMSARKHWLAYGPKASGQLVVDDGAKRALVEGGKSLLSAGLKSVKGDFGLGAVVALVDTQGVEFARGLAGYGSDDLRKVAGARSADIESILGYKYLDEVIHRDDLVLL